MEKKTLLLYQEYKEYFAMLDPQDCKDLLLAVFSYNVGEDVPELEGMAKMAFVFMANAMDRNNEKYQKQAERSRENGKKGGRPTKDESESLGQSKGARESEKKPVYPSKTSTNKDALEDKNLENPVGFSKTQKTQQVFSKPRKPDKDKVKDKDKDKDNKNRKTVQTAFEQPVAIKQNRQDERFEAWWVEYPRKVGKQATRKIWCKLAPDAALYDRIIDATKAQAHCAQWRKENGRFIPNPATWLNQGRWDDDLTALNSGGRTIGNRDFAGHSFEDYDALEE